MSFARLLKSSCFSPFTYKSLPVDTFFLMYQMATLEESVNLRIESLFEYSHIPIFIEGETNLWDRKGEHVTIFVLEWSLAPWVGK